MANQEHLDILKQGEDVWNNWRGKHPDIQPDLPSADLSGATLSGANLRDADLRSADLSGATLTGATLYNANLSFANLKGADLREATRSYSVSFAPLALHLHLLNLEGTTPSGTNLSGATLRSADLSGATLSGATLYNADLSFANLSGANLRRADLSFANLSRATLSGANLSEADLNRAILVGTNFTDAILTGCHIYGIAAWNVELTGATQNSLIITPEDEPEITVDNLKIAQFIYLLLNNQEIRDFIDTIAKKAVLILGRFTPERKAILDALREALRTDGYLPILFDFEKPASRDITETVSTLAHLAHFVIADITDAKSIPQELMMIVPNLPSVPVQPLILESQHEYGMFEHFMRFSWVLPVYYYRDQGNLLATLKEQVIEPAEQKAKELEKR